VLSAFLFHLYTTGNVNQFIDALMLPVTLGMWRTGPQRRSEYKEETCGGDMYPHTPDRDDDFLDTLVKLHKLNMAVTLC
jgi:hypothetical protein